MALKLDAEGNLSVNDSAVLMSDVKSRMEEFILRRGRQHIITLDASPDCRYDAYFQLQHNLGEAYKEAREALAQKQYGRGLNELTSIDHDKIMAECPQRVAENYHEAPVPEASTVPEVSTSGSSKGGRP